MSHGNGLFTSCDENIRKNIRVEEKSRLREKCSTVGEKGSSKERKF